MTDYAPFPGSAILNPKAVLRDSVRRILTVQGSGASLPMVLTGKPVLIRPNETFRVTIRTPDAWRDAPEVASIG